MAADGVDISNLHLGCDVVYDYPCIPCSKEDRNVEAEQWCVDCSESVCDRCARQHKKFSQMSTHQLITINVAKESGQARLSRPTERCAQHPDKFVALYCTTHDIAGCGRCMTLDHRHCKDVITICKAAKGIRHGKEYNDTVNSLADTVKTLSSIKEDSDEKKAKLAEQFEDTKSAMKEHRARIETYLDTLEKTTTDQLNEMFKMYDDRARRDIKSLEDIIELMKTSKEILENLGADKEHDIFLQIKKVKKLEKEGEMLSKEMIANDERIHYQPNVEMEEYLSTWNSMGVFLKGDILYTPKTHIPYNIKTKACKTECDITGTCPIPENKLVLVDQTNELVKLLDLVTVSMLEHLSMPGKPYAACTVDQNNIAVTLCKKKRVQFVSYDKHLSPGSSFDVGEKCRGIAYVKQQLFVCCGGASGESAGHVRVFDKDGLQLRTIQENNDFENIFTIPIHIAVNWEHNLLSITDYGKCVVTIDLKGNVVSTFSDPCLQDTKGICFDGSGQMFVAGKDSHNVVQVGRKGQLLGTLLSKNDGIKSPRSLYFDAARSALIVTQRSHTMPIWEMV